MGLFSPARHYITFASRYNWPSKYRSDWFLWYGEVPPELQRFEELSIKINQLDEQLTKLEIEVLPMRWTDLGLK